MMVKFSLFLDVMLVDSSKILRFLNLVRNAINIFNENCRFTVSCDALFWMKKCIFSGLGISFKESNMLQYNHCIS